jgi:hypothetical protein
MRIRPIVEGQQLAGPHALVDHDNPEIIVPDEGHEQFQLNGILVLDLAFLANKHTAGALCPFAGIPLSLKVSRLAAVVPPPLANLDKALEFGEIIKWHNATVFHPSASSKRTISSLMKALSIHIWLHLRYSCKDSLMILTYSASNLLPRNRFLNIISSSFVRGIITRRG